MYGLTKIMGLIKCESRTGRLAAVAMAALIFLSALPNQARAQGNTYSGATVVYLGTIGAVPGQKVSVTVPNFYFQDGSVRFVKHSIRVIENQPGVTENESGLVYSGESGGLNEHELGHVFTFSVPGDFGRGRVQLWIQVESLQPSATQASAGDSSAVMLPPTFELMDYGSEKSVLIGLLLPAILKVRERDNR
ncbi:MAG TPA: hypothetical protein VGN90_12075 [Pyrinomonadaceae bacterium]|jgi:hypothetical protein|nr:hypothetical protein [Pyrinomonadaceae bacterium]